MKLGRQAVIGTEISLLVKGKGKKVTPIHDRTRTTQARTVGPLTPQVSPLGLPFPDPSLPFPSPGWRCPRLPTPARAPEHGFIRGRSVFHPGHGPVPPRVLRSPYLCSSRSPRTRKRVPAVHAFKKSNQSHPGCFASPPYKNMAALRAPPSSRHAPGSRSGLSVGQEDGVLWRRAANPSPILGVTKGSIASSILLASGRTGSAGLSRSHRGLAHSPRPPPHGRLPPGPGAHAQGGPRGEASGGGGGVPRLSRPEVGVVLRLRLNFVEWIRG